MPFLAFLKKQAQGHLVSETPARHDSPTLKHSAFLWRLQSPQQVYEALLIMPGDEKKPFAIDFDADGRLASLRKHVPKGEEYKGIEVPVLMPCALLKMVNGETRRTSTANVWKVRRKTYSLRQPSRHPTRSNLILIVQSLEILRVLFKVLKRDEVHMMYNSTKDTHECPKSTEGVAPALFTASIAMSASSNEDPKAFHVVYPKDWPDDCLKFAAFVTCCNVTYKFNDVSSLFSHHSKKD